MEGEDGACAGPGLAAYRAGDGRGVGAWGTSARPCSTALALLNGVARAPTEDDACPASAAPVVVLVVGRAGGEVVPTIGSTGVTPPPSVTESTEGAPGAEGGTGASTSRMSPDDSRSCGPWRLGDRLAAADRRAGDARAAAGDDRTTAGRTGVCVRRALATLPALGARSPSARTLLCVGRGDGPPV